MLLLWLVVLSLLRGNYAEECLLTYAAYPDNEPVLATTLNQIIPPEYDALRLNADDEITVNCPPPKNNIDKLRIPSVVVKCVGNYTFALSNRTSYTFSQLNCTRPVTGDFIISNQSCTDGIVKNIGYNISGYWNTLIGVCYDDLHGRSVYSEHKLYGSAIAYAKKESSRPSWKSGGLADGVNADFYYTQTSQKATLTTILGSASLAGQYINGSSYFARGHLSPDGDFVYVSSQFSTYFYINTVPQWQAVNNGNWKSLEGQIRSTAAATNQTYRVFTGGYGILKLADVNKTDRDIYLQVPDKLPVPLYTWKIMYDEESGEGMGFVALNNPFAPDAAPKKICKDVCQDYNWGSSSWSNVKRGYLYCCLVNDLLSVIATSLPNMNVSKPLYFGGK